jgi:hypothetical protein
LIDCVDSFFGIIPFDSQSTETQQHLISFFSKFLFILFGRDVWNRDHIENDCRSIAFPVILDMTQYAFHLPAPSHYQLVSVIARLGDPRDYQGHYINFLRVFGQWVRFDDTDVQPVDESAALEDNFPEIEDSSQTASILLYVSDNWTRHSSNEQFLNHSVFFSFFHSQASRLDPSRSHIYGSYCNALKVISKNQNKQSRPDIYSIK